MSAPPPLGVPGAAAVFGTGAVLVWLATQVLVPRVAATTGLELVVCWFLVGSVALFGPMLAAAYLLLWLEGAPQPMLWRERLRFGAPTWRDGAWTLGASIGIGVASGGIVLLLRAVTGEADLHPDFMAFEPVGPGRYWILLAWAPFFALNVLAEEVLWRGVLLPRQEAAHGRWAWLVHGAGWGVFHLAFGWEVLVATVPTLLVLPYTVQRRKNTWIGVVLHAGLNGPGFLALAFGLA